MAKRYLIQQKRDCGQTSRERMNRPVIVTESSDEDGGKAANQPPAMSGAIIISGWSIAFSFIVFRILPLEKTTISSKMS